ncbi:hypothetical protein ACIBO2_51875 [Nonomuraea sp. NPDC050022]|uniref:hypothetical protein n=1 Tax=Nonomuraea sp. NPDC050022 TaxID=3364358 RepID=UPI00379E2F6C
MSTSDKADAYGWDALISLQDQQIADLVHPLGLADARILYLRSLHNFVDPTRHGHRHPLIMSAQVFIEVFAAEVSGASYKVAQRAALRPSLRSRAEMAGPYPIDP